LTGALAAASFVRAFGITFLAKPRSAHAEHAQEVPASMLIPMSGLVGLCILLGVAPEVMTGILHRTLASFISPRSTVQLGINGQVVASSGAISIPVVSIQLLVGLAVAVILYRLYGKPQTVVGETWTCGIVPTPRMQYTATGFSKPIRMAFRNILRGQRETVVDSAHTNRYFGRKLSYRISIRYVVTDGLYRPLHERLLKAARFMKTIQAGSVQLYVGYILTVTVVVLIMSVRW
jgi:hydrogenase-4 component B